MKSENVQALVAEFVGTALLLAAIVGSGIMGERLSSGNPAVALLANSIATGAMLFALISTFGPVSGAHFNPIVTAVMVFQKQTGLSKLCRYGIAQIAGAFAGVASANVMFGLAPFELSRLERAGSFQIFSESVATFGLLTVILFCTTFRAEVTALAVAGYITSAYWFTASTSFANPAVTLARAFTDTFSGIRIVDVPAFVVAQVLGAAAAAAIFRLVMRPVALVESKTLSKKESA